MACSCGVRLRANTTFPTPAAGKCLPRLARRSTGPKASGPQSKHDGEITRTKAVLREHPALKHELSNRSFVVRTLARLGLDVEAVKPVGRPPGAFGR